MSVSGHSRFLITDNVEWERLCEDQNNDNDIDDSNNNVIITTYLHSYVTGTLYILFHLIFLGDTTNQKTMA